MAHEFQVYFQNLSAVTVTASSVINVYRWLLGTVHTAFMMAVAGSSDFSVCICVAIWLHVSGYRYLEGNFI